GVVGLAGVGIRRHGLQVAVGDNVLVLAAPLPFLVVEGAGLLVVGQDRAPALVLRVGFLLGALLLGVAVARLALLLRLPAVLRLLAVLGLLDALGLRRRRPGAAGVPILLVLAKLPRRRAALLLVRAVLSLALLVDAQAILALRRAARLLARLVLTLVVDPRA